MTTVSLGFSRTQGWASSSKETSPVPTPPRRIKLRYFFEARDSRPFHCTATINRNTNDDFRPWMSLTEGNFDVADTGVLATPTASCAVDGQTDGRCSLAHEIGHATGLVDEYLDPLDMPLADPNRLWNDPPIPQYDQVSSGMPYSADYHLKVPPGSGVPSDGCGRGVMHGHTLLRMHCHWPHLRWFNSFGDVQDLVGADTSWPSMSETDR